MSKASLSLNAAFVLSSVAAMDAALTAGFARTEGAIKPPQGLPSRKAHQTASRNPES